MSAQITFPIALPFTEEKKRTIFYSTMNFARTSKVFVACAFSTTNLLLLTRYSLQKNVQTIQNQSTAKTVK